MKNRQGEKSVFVNCRIALNIKTDDVPAEDLDLKKDLLIWCFCHDEKGSRY